MYDYFIKGYAHSYLVIMNRTRLILTHRKQKNMHFWKKQKKIQNHRSKFLKVEFILDYCIKD